MTVRTRRKSQTSIAECPLYGISPLALANLFGLPESFCVKWKAQLRSDPRKAAMVARFINHDLGAFDAAWSGWVCKDGMIWPPDTSPASPAQVRAIPHMRDQLREFERAQRWVLDHSYGERLREKTRIEATALLERAIEALRQR